MSIEIEAESHERPRNLPVAIPGKRARIRCRRSAVVASFRANELGSYSEAERFRVQCRVPGPILARALSCVRRRWS